MSRPPPNSTIACILSGAYLTAMPYLLLGQSPGVFFLVGPLVGALGVIGLVLRPEWRTTITGATMGAAFLWAPLMMSPIRGLPPIGYLSAAFVMPVILVVAAFIGMVVWTLLMVVKRLMFRVVRRAWTAFRKRPEDATIADAAALERKGVVDEF